MALALPKVCSMGDSQTGLVGTIGVALLNPNGTVHTARATAGIYEIGGGCYGKNISFPDNWIGIIKWDTGGGSPVYAVKEYTIDGAVIWDEILTGASHNIATSAGRRLRQAADALIIREETCRAGGANNEVILDAGASAVDDFYPFDIVILESGTGAGQSRHIDSYTGSSKTAIVNRDWTTNPDGTTNYVLRFDSTKHVHGLEPTARQHVRDAMKLAPAAGVPTAGSVDKHLDDIEADVTGLNGDAMRGTDGAYTGTPPTVDQIAAAVLAGVVEGTISMKQALRIMVAALAGISNGAETSSQHFKNLDNTRDRITATMDKGGNRLNIVFDLGD